MRGNKKIFLNDRGDEQSAYLLALEDFFLLLVLNYRLYRLLYVKSMFLPKHQSLKPGITWPIKKTMQLRRHWSSVLRLNCKTRNTFRRSGFEFAWICRLGFVLNLNKSIIKLNYSDRQILRTKKFFKKKTSHLEHSKLSHLEPQYLEHSKLIVYMF